MAPSKKHTHACRLVQRHIHASTIQILLTNMNYNLLTISLCLYSSNQHFIFIFITKLTSKGNFLTTKTYERPTTKHFTPHRIGI